MRGPKFKLIHKKTGLTFKQKAKKENGGIVTDHGINYHVYEEDGRKLIPLLLDSGYPAVYVEQAYYPYMEILPAKDWDVVLKGQ